MRPVAVLRRVVDPSPASLLFFVAVSKAEVESASLPPPAGLKATDAWRGF